MVSKIPYTTPTPQSLAQFFNALYKQIIMIADLTSAAHAGTIMTNPSVYQQDGPGPATPEMPDTNKPEVEKPDVHEVPERKEPEIEETDIPEAPDTDINEIPDTNIDEMPDTSTVGIP